MGKYCVCNRNLIEFAATKHPGLETKKIGPYVCLHYFYYCWRFLPDVSASLAIICIIKPVFHGVKFPKIWCYKVIHNIPFSFMHLLFTIISSLNLEITHSVAKIVYNSCSARAG